MSMYSTIPPFSELTRHPGRGILRAMGRAATEGGRIGGVRSPQQWKDIRNTHDATEDFSKETSR